MANILGSLFVELKANTAAFLSAMDKASYAAGKTGKDIEKAFSKVGDVAAAALAPFGEIGSQIGEAFDRIGSFAGTAMKNVGGMGGALGGVAAVGAGTVAALAAIDAGAIALAVHTTETVKRMADLAEASGSNVERFSALAYAAQQANIPQEALAAGLEKMSKAALTAATAAPGTATAFSRIGVAVKASNGQLRDGVDIFEDVAARLSTMENRTAATGLAMEIFGKSGAALLPLLNQGKQGIEAMIARAKELGLVVDELTVKKVRAFDSALTDLKAGASGVSISVMKQLLPSLQQLVNLMVEGFKDSRSSISDLISGLSTLTKVFIILGDFAFTVIRQLVDNFKSGSKAMLAFAQGFQNFANPKNLFTGRSVGEAIAAYREIAEIAGGFIDRTKTRWEDFAEFQARVLNPPPFKPPAEPAKNTRADLRPKAAKDDTLARIQERIAKLQDEAAGWAKVAEAGTQAEALIAEAVKKGNSEFDNLKAQAAKSAPALALVQQNEQMIKAAGEMSVFGAAIKTLTGDLDKQGLQLQQQAKAAEELAAAYEGSGRAISEVALDKQFTKQQAAIDVLRGVYEQLSRQLGASSPMVQQFAAAIDLENQKLAANREALRAALSSELNATLAEQLANFEQTAPAVEAVNRAYMENEAAVRRARVELEVYQFIQEQISKGIGVTADQIDKFRRTVEEKDRVAHEGALDQEAAQYSLNAIYDKQVMQLERVREVLQGEGRDTLLISNAIDDARKRFRQMTDDAILAGGNWRDSWRAMLDEIALAGENFQQKFFGAMGKAIDDLSTQLADFVVKGKADFKGLFQSLEQEILKAGFQQMIGGIAQKISGWIFGKTGGLFSKNDGSDANHPLYVSIVGAGGAVAGAASSILGGGGGIFSSILGLFGGFLAGGGDVIPGKAYMVGEQHPEFFLPRVSGTIVPQLAATGGPTFYIDARGGDAGTEYRVARAIQAAHADAVIRAGAFARDQAARRP